MGIEGVVDSFQQIAEAFHGAAAQIGGELTGVEGIAGLESGGTEIADTTSNGVGLVAQKTKLLQHAQHEFMLGVVRKMLVNSLKNKLKIMLPLFVGSLVFPSLVRALWPAFVALGAHLGMEAVESGHELIHHVKKKSHKNVRANHGVVNPNIVLDHKVPDIISIPEMIDKARKVDRNTTFEITAAVLGSIDNLPLVDQVSTMLVYGIGMTGGVYGVTTVLVKMEDWGQRLEAWNPRHPLMKGFVNGPAAANQALQKLTLDLTSVTASCLKKPFFLRSPALSECLQKTALDASIVISMSIDKALAKKPLNVHTGLAIQKATPRVFHLMPWLGTAAKFVTSGRVINHASKTLETFTSQTASTMAHLPYIGSDLTGLVTTIVAWGGTGIAVGIGAEIVIKSPLKKLMWNNAARAILIRTMIEAKNLQQNLMQENHRLFRNKPCIPHVQSYSALKL